MDWTRPKGPMTHSLEQWEMDLLHMEAFGEDFIRSLN